MKTKIEDLEVASYQLVPPSSGHFGIKLEKVYNQDGQNKWAVRNAGDCLNTSGEFEYEPMPSNRGEDFKHRCRFDKIEDALLAWDLHKKKFEQSSEDKHKNHVTKAKLIQ